MAYVYFIVYIVVLWLLAPIRWITNLLVRPFFTRYEFNNMFFKSVHQSDENLVRNKIFEIHDKLLQNIDEIMKHGDSAKFVGMLASVSGYSGCDILEKYITDNYKFDRTPTGTSTKPFSGDMLAGYAYGILELHKQGYVTTAWSKFLRALEKSIFKKPYFTLKTTGVDNYDRGYLLRPFFFNAGHFLPLLLVLKILYRETGEIKYNIMYGILLATAFVDILINPTFVIKFWRLRYVQWYYVHSNFLYYYLLHELSNNEIYRYGMNIIYKRFPFNPDFIILMEDSDNLDTVKDFIEDYFHQNVTEIKTFTDDVKHSYGKATIEVYNIKDLLKLKFNEAKFYEFIVVCPPRVNKKDYQWEKSMVQYEWKNTPMNGIDFVHIGINFLKYNSMYGKE